jgi:S-(hydroxymethyl)glutathione dehydrogenase/alcohol dehydrogenase
VRPLLLFLQRRTLTGTSFGGGHQRTDLPMLIDLFMDGRYKLTELIGRRLPLAGINEAFDLLRQGEVGRSVIVFE